MGYINDTGLAYLWGKIKAYVTSIVSGKADKVISAANGNFAGLDSNGNLTDSGHKHSDYATKQEVVVYNATNNTSGTASITSSPYTAAIWRVDLSNEITELYTGLTILYKIPVAGDGTYGTLLRIDGTNSSTDNSSNLYPVCANVTTMVSTRYAVGCIIALTFDETQYGLKLYYNSSSASTTTEDGTGWEKKGCWKIADYNSNTDTIGYLLRGNSGTKTVTDRARYYKIYFTSADGTQWVPASANYTNSATSSKTVNQRPIDPFGPIVYTSASTNYTAGSVLAAATIWLLYTLSLGYSFNTTGAELTLTSNSPVYVKCAPQSDGSAIMDATTPIVQTLPTTEDSKIYIFLGFAYSATNVELRIEHPVYYYKNGGIRQWSNTIIDYNNLINKPTIPTVPVQDVTVNGTSVLDGTTAKVVAVTDAELDRATDYSKQYFTIESLESNNTISFVASDDTILKTIYVSTDNGKTWTQKTSSTEGTTLATLGVGLKVLIKGFNNFYAMGDENEENFYWNHFWSNSKLFVVYGNIMSLLFGDSFINITTFNSNYDYVFSGLFCRSYVISSTYSNYVMSAENLILPATTLTLSCYADMFCNCKLKKAPKLPATTLAECCYLNMFFLCNSLKEAPELPATTLLPYCYAYMFFLCNSLKEAPELPATTLVEGCYEQMFGGNKNRTATNYIKALFTTTPGTDYTLSWVKYVAETGTFIKADDATWNVTGNNGIPSGWDVYSESEWSEVKHYELSNLATTTYVDTAIDNIPDPMIFKGSLGTGGTITSLPAASSTNAGYTYKVITDGTYASQAAKAGDTFISDGSSWTLIPSGDEPSGTVTSVTLNATNPIAIDDNTAITSSGSRTISHANSGVTAGTYKSVTVNATGHITAGTNPTTLSGYGITDAKIENGVITLGSNTITPITSAPSAPGTLNTSATTAQTVSSSEDLSGNITLHKVSKTGSYNDLNDKPVAELSNNYATSTDSNDDLLLSSGDTYEEAFGKLEKLIIDDEEIIANALNDLNSNSVKKSSTTGLLKNDGTVDANDYLVEEDVFITPDANGHDYVDLGLPSGTLWATTNVGATNAEDYGNYYAWGRTTPYSENDAKYDGTEYYLDSEHDVASLLWGGTWHIPTESQIIELVLYTKITSVSNYYKFENLQDSTKYIIIPLAGYYLTYQPASTTPTSAESYAYVWSNTNFPTDSSGTTARFFSPGGSNPSVWPKVHGASVRPVLDGIKLKGEELHFLFRADWNLSISDSPNVILNKPTVNGVLTTNVSSGVTYYPIVGGNNTSSSTIKNIDSTGYKYNSVSGTTSAAGYSTVTLGNGTASGTAGSKRGQLALYDNGTHSNTLNSALLTANRTLSLPDEDGTLATQAYVTANGGAIDTIQVDGTALTITNKTVNITGKADKVTSATSGNFAALDANGNLVDSGYSNSDYSIVTFRQW